MAQHDQPEIEKNPAQSQIDPDQLNPDGTPGADYQLYVDEATAQQDGSRNPRVMNTKADKHNTEPLAENTSTAYDSSNNGNASGITSQPLAKEKASQAKVGSEQKNTPTDQPSIHNARKDANFPKGLDEVTDTVEISTETSKY